MVPITGQRSGKGLEIYLLQLIVHDESQKCLKTKILALKALQCIQGTDKL